VDPGAPQVLVTGLQVPWGLTWLPDGDALLSERDTGRLLRVPAAGGDPQELTRFDDVDNAGEGGLLGLALGPDDGLVYAYYTGPSDNRVVRFDVASPTEREPVVTGHPQGPHAQRRPAGLLPGRRPVRRHRRLRPGRAGAGPAVAGRQGAARAGRRR
jgi:glucose/arabinose dehydrogenase